MSDPLAAGVFIQHCRLRSGMSARELSVKAGLGAAYVCRIEAGTMQPSIRAFARLARALDMSDREIGIVMLHEASIPLRAGKA